MNFARAAALEGEVHVALVGDHRALPGHERFAEAHAQQLGVLVRDRLGFLLAEPAVDQITGDAGETVPGRPRRRTALLHLGLRLAARLRLRIPPALAHAPGAGAPPIGARLDLTLMGDLIGPALPVPPAVLVAAFGIRLPSAGSRSSHDSLLCASGFRRHYAVVGAALACLSAWQRKSTGYERRAPSRSSSSTRAWCCSRRRPALVALAVVWWLFGAGWAALLLVGLVLGGGAAVLMKRN